MCDIYFIRGTITIRVEGDESSVTSKVGVIPCEGFLTPDNPRKAIAFPVYVTESHLDHADTARLIVLNGKTCEFDADIIKEFIPALLSIAGQQKPVELRISKKDNGNSAAKCKIVGFVYPAPYKHANWC